MAAELQAAVADSRLLDKARQLVSKNKKRFQEDGFDLDLSYITPRIIAMGFPSTGWEAVYRNPLRQVQRFFSERHGELYKVYNLCSERDYDLKGTFPLIERFPFDDHNVCPMEMLVALVDSIEAYLGADPRHVVAVHCKAGKGRTGMVVSALLLRLGVCSTASEALRLFAERRTHNGKGVTIPSQRRYVQYYERLLKSAASIPGDAALTSMTIPTHEFELVGIRLTSVPACAMMPGTTRCTPYFKILANEPPPGDDIHTVWQHRQVFCYREALARLGEDLKAYESGHRWVYLDCSRFGVRLSGEVVIKFFAAHTVSKSERMFQVWFSTAFVRKGHRVVQFSRARIDGVHKDKKCKRFAPDFAMQLFLRSTGGSPAQSPRPRIRSSMRTHSLLIQEISPVSATDVDSDEDLDMDQDEADMQRPERRCLTAFAPRGVADEAFEEAVEEVNASKRPISLPTRCFPKVEEAAAVPWPSMSTQPSQEPRPQAGATAATAAMAAMADGDSSSLEDLSHESDVCELPSG